MATSDKITVQATVRELREKAVWLTLTDGTSLWFPLRSARNNGDGTWSISPTVYNKALEEHRQYTEYRNSTITIKEGTWGTCKNGSYWLRTCGENVDVERPVKTELAFVRNATVNEDGTLTISAPDAQKALDDAAYRTNKGNLEIHFAGELSTPF